MNELVRRGGRRWPKELLAQLTHPLALLLAVASLLAALTHNSALAIAIVVVIVLNAGFAFFEEQHAERAIEALAAYVPKRVLIVRDGHHVEINATELVPGDLMVLEEGNQICADGRLVEGAVELDMSTLTGEAVPVVRAAAPNGTDVPLLERADLVFSGTTCTGGDARVVVTATGMQTELGRIAALSERVDRGLSPLERQVKRAWLIAVVASASGLVFLPAGLLGGLGWAAAAILRSG
jgi:P-type E1-E2 ATPase